MVCQLQPWRPPEGQDARWGDSPRWEIRHTHFRTLSSQGWHEHGRNATTASSSPTYGGQYSCPLSQWDQYGFRIVLKAGPLTSAGKWNKGFLLFWSQQMYGPWGWNLVRDSMLKRHESFLASYVIIMQVTWNPEKVQEEPRWSLSCEVQRRVRTTKIYSRFLTADSFQGKHNEYAIFLEMKLVYFSSRTLAFLQNKRLSIPKLNFGNATSGFLTTSHKGLGLGRREREVVQEERKVVAEKEKKKIMMWSCVHSLGKRAVMILP